MATLKVKNLPDELYRRLQDRAKRHHRSVEQEATHILEQALARSEELSILDLRGLGKQHWCGIEATKYVADERDSWE